MNKLSNNVKKNLDTLKSMYGNSGDIVTREITINKKKVGYIYLESVSSDDKISDFLMKDLSSYTKFKKIGFFENLLDSLENSIPNSHFGIIQTFDEIPLKLSAGYTCVFVEGYNKGFSLETKATIDRGVTEATTETIIRGPKDSFTENHAINLGLIRKRIKDSNLWMEDIFVGTRSKTKITISYIQDVADLKMVKKLKQKIENIDIDGIIDSGYIRDFLIKSRTSAFPQLISTERPDLASSSLLLGKIVILVENTPFVLIIPAVLSDFLHSPEDCYQKSINANFIRILRIIAFLITILLPGLYIALTTFNQEIIPDELLISLAVQREGVPFPTAIETLMMIITFEILRESDIRIPSASGSAIGIVGALVLGEAAVTAGVVSPIVIIVIGVTSISGLLFYDVDFVNGIRCWRIVFILFSSIMGILGFIVAALLFTIKLSSMEFEEIPYLAPLSPFYLDDQKDSLVRAPRYEMFKRPTYLKPKNKVKMRDNNETKN